MTRRVRSLMLAALCGVALLVAGGVRQAGAQQPARSAPETRIYMMRGLFGIFSTGIDSLAKRLRDAGYNPRIFPWDQWGEIASDILDNSRAGDTGQIILIGHSLGSDSTIQVANAVQQANIPIDLIVTFDITQPLQVPRNVQRFINFFQHNGFGTEAVPGYGFSGELQNINLTSDKSIGHGNIDEIPQLQQLVVQKIFDIAFEQSKQPSARKRRVKPIS
ncbi:MAG: alpha/beta hydrolase [Pseudorhodoplanes sp.]